MQIITLITALPGAVAQGLISMWSIYRQLKENRQILS